MLVLAATVGAQIGSKTWPVTRAETSNYAETSHYSDVVSYLRQLQAAGAPISVQEIGTSTAGKAMPLVIASYPPVSSPAEARRLGKPIVYIQANIHAGEVEGKEAAMIILRRLSQDGPKGLLGKIVLLVTPIYNIDGNEQFGPVSINRPEQDGLALVGHRANGQGLDLNRDAIKAEAPETRAVLETRVHDLGSGRDDGSSHNGWHPPRVRAHLRSAAESGHRAGGLQVPRGMYY